MASADEPTAYETLNVTPDVAEADLRKAYRQQSLKVHPDRHPNNPDAAQKFHELTQAYELLLDPMRRTALDAIIRIKEARKTRFASYDNKRKVLQEELEESERAFKKSKAEKDTRERDRQREEETIKEENRRLRKEKEEEAAKKAAERDADAKKTKEVVPTGPLDTTIRIKYPLAQYPTLTTPLAISTHLSSFGSIDASSIVLSMKPTKKNPTKPPKYATALIPFKNVADAFSAVVGSGRGVLESVEVSWAGGSEPEVVQWLKKSGKLGIGSNGKPAPTAPTINPPNDNQPYSSFPDSFSFDPSTPDAKPPPSVAGVDYESLTLMRLRQAEREKLEREIREAEE